VHNKLLMELFKNWISSEKTLKEILIELIDYCKHYEQYFTDVENKVSDLLIDLLWLFNNNWKFVATDEEILSKFWRWDNDIKSSCFVYFTMWIVYSIFFRNPNFQWLLDAVNIWWDTDSFWAIIWNMIWAYNWKFYEEEFAKWVKIYEEIKNIWEKFTKQVI